MSVMFHYLNNASIPTNNQVDACIGHCFALEPESMQMLVLLLLAMARGDMVKGKAWEHFGLLNELRAEGS